MAFTQEISIDEAMRELIVNTRFDDSELVSHYSTKEFMSQVHRDIALKVASKIFEHIGPAIDEAMKGIKFGEDR